MNFMDWLADNLDAPSRSNKLARLLISDMNNGCGSARYGVSQWKAHFEEKHKDNANILIDMLILAYAEYVLTHKNN
jgi:hypothetical protein